MTSSKRNFQNFTDKDEFDFYIENGIIHFPTLYNTDSKLRIRVWNIYLKLFGDDNFIEITNNLLENKNINKLKHKYTKIYAKYYTETGILDMKITKSEPTIITKGKNIGKKNETNVLTQGLIEIRSKYLKKIDSGYSKNIKSTDNKIPYPMALHRYDNFSNKLSFPCFIQPKLDGIRIMVYYDIELNSVIIKSRKLKNILGFDYIKNELYDILKENKTLYLDGELYCHGIQLQDISSMVRNEDRAINDKILKFNIFDCFDVSNPKWKFIDRLEFIYNICKSHNSDCNDTNYVISVLTKKVENKAEGDKVYNEYIKDNYEGVVYKNIDGLYKFSYDKELRSYDNLKRKQQFDEEFEIIDYTTGTQGKYVGSIIFIMKTKDNQTFNVTPNVKYEEQQEMYKLAQKDFDKYYKGKMATIRYDDLSKNGIPLRAKWITIRDYE